MADIFHPTAAATLQRLANMPPQASILHGERGVGLLRAATVVANHKPSLIITPEPASETSSTLTISVERIRTLYEQTRGVYSSRYIVIIDDAEKMSIGAQNAFLKLLEEPNRNVHFILTTHDPELLLATICSRAEQHHIPLCTPEQSRTLIAAHTNDAALTRQLLFIANGRPATITTYLNVPNSLSNDAILYKDAKELITSKSRFAQQKILARYNKERQLAAKFIEILISVQQFILQSSPQQPLVRKTQTLLDIHEKLAKNASVKLQLERIVL